MNHSYKGYVMMRTGTKEYPWNIYRMDYSQFLKKEVPTHVGFERTLKECRMAIDNGMVAELR